MLQNALERPHEYLLSLIVVEQGSGIRNLNAAGNRHSIALYVDLGGLEEPGAVVDIDTIDVILPGHRVEAVAFDQPVVEGARLCMLSWCGWAIGSNKIGWWRSPMCAVTPIVNRLAYTFATHAGIEVGEVG
jgi:hypothetical protein